MSFDLCILASKQESYEEALRIYHQLCDGEVPDAEPNAPLEQFSDQLSTVYPELGTLDENEIDDSPWSCDHDRSNVHLIVCIRWDRHAEVSPLILELAKRHQLVVLNPQSRTLYPA
jgi:hypothetical protein